MGAGINTRRHPSAATRKSLQARKPKGDESGVKGCF